MRCEGETFSAFDEELEKLGWSQARNLTIERRGAEGHTDRLPELAVELVRSKPDVIASIAPQATRAAKDAAGAIPIVFSFVADPVSVGLVQSLARPGGNVTGVTTLAPGSYIAKNFELIRELLPNARRVAALTNPANEVARLRLSQEIPMAVQFGLAVDVIDVRAPDDVPTAIAKAKALGTDALLIVGDPILHNPPTRVPELAAQAGIPAMYLPREMVQSGGLISYSPDFISIARRQARLVDRVLRGASPADLPIEHPTKYDLIINLRAAKALGLAVPASLLSRADEVIE